MQCTIHIASVQWDVSDSLSKKFLPSAPGSNCLFLPGRCEESNMYFVAVVSGNYCSCFGLTIFEKPPSKVAKSKTDF